jgi:NAD(P)-dependent dehydrogenase (short-subunit alcohol dehydrogenase family)
MMEATRRQAAPWSVTREDAMGELVGKVAVVTGAGRGIGAAVVRELAHRGAAVALLARNEAEVRRVAAEVAADDARVLPLAVDVSDVSALAVAIRQIEEVLGGADILVNNAGIIGPLGRFAECPPEEWARTIAINLLGAGYAAQLVLPMMQQRGWGRIVNVTSGAGQGSGIARALPYSVSKAGLDMLTRGLAAEVAGTGVAVVGVLPGVVDTAMQGELRAAPAERFGEESSRRFWDHYTAGDLLDPAVPGRLIAVLCGAAGVAYSGQNLRVSDPLAQQLLTADGNSEGVERR